MSAIAIALIVFACMCTGAVLGSFLRNRLPPNHLSPDSLDAVKLVTGLVGTMSALVLGLLISSAKGSYDAVTSELTQMSAKVIFLDRLLALYGPETKEARDLLRVAVVRGRDRLWPQEGKGPSQVGPPAPVLETMLGKVQALSPKDEVQRSLRDQALSMGYGVGETRWLFYEQSSPSVPTPMLVSLVFWLAAIFVGFGLFAPRNGTVIASLFFAGLSVSGAMFLIMEMYTPFSGVMHVSSAPLRFAIAHLSQ
jgi:hypothetical protein